MRTVFITGISRGIGRALAERFLTAGDFVIGTSTAGRVDYAHDNLVVYKLDCYRPETITSCLQQVTAINRPLDILFNNAGVLKDSGETAVILEKLKATLEVNLYGVIQITEACIPLMQAGGHIINISSRAGSLEDTTHTNYPSYKISKAALNMYTRTLAIRLGERLTVSSVHPGWVRTDMGGHDADIAPEEAAEDIFQLAGADIETGQFWFKGEKCPW